MQSWIFTIIILDFSIKWSLEIERSKGRQLLFVYFCFLQLWSMYNLKMLGCFNTILGQKIGTNPIVGLKKMQFLGLSIFDPKLGKNNPAFFRVNASNCWVKVWICMSKLILLNVSLVFMENRKHGGKVLIMATMSPNNI